MDPLYTLPCLLPSGFTSDFQFYDYYCNSCLHPALSLVFYFISLLFLSYHIMSNSCLISLAIYLLAPACLCSRHGFQMHVYDSDLSIHECLSMHATWHSHHHSLGEFWLPWILMSRSWSMERVDSPSCCLRCAAIAWMIGRPSRAPSFQAPLLGSRVFLWWLWASFSTIHTCTSLCILAFVPIDDVIFL